VHSLKLSGKTFQIVSFFLTRQLRFILSRRHSPYVFQIALITLLPPLTSLTKSNYETYVNHLQTIVNDENTVTVLHVPFSPSDDPSPALSANSKVGATEVAFFYFPSTLTRSDRGTIMSSVDKVRPVVQRSEALAIYDGWALEEAVPNPGPQASEGEKSQVYVTVLGWVDVEAHMRFQGTEDFQQNIHHMLGIKEMRYTEFNHAKLHAV